MADPTSSPASSPLPPSAPGERHGLLLEPPGQPFADSFPPVDANEDDSPPPAEPAPDPALIAASPRREPIRLADLIDAVAGIRIIFARGPAAIPVTALIAIVGSLL